MTIALSRSPTEEAVRVRLGASLETPAEMLAALATDRSVVVRVALALNSNTPGPALEQLARDPDERVRAMLAGRLAHLAPGLSAPDQTRLQAHAYDALLTLIADEAARVRGAVAEVVKNMADAPRSLVLRLARDCAASVSEDVIRFSPILTDDDLLALLDQPGSAATSLAVARRPDLTEPIADAIVAAEDAAAIGALLSNRSAQIREATLETVIARAADHIEWHAPLVHRPTLSPRSARALAEIVATHLLEVLADRADLDQETTAALRDRLALRLATDPIRSTTKFCDPPTELALLEAHRLARSHHLDEAAMLEALRTGRPRLACAILAVAAVVPIAAVERAVSLRSARGLISLAWSAGFSMAAGTALQAAIGNLGPAGALAPTAGGGFPLAVDEMRWQMDFLRRMGC